MGREGDLLVSTSDFQTSAEQQAFEATYKAARKNSLSILDTAKWAWLSSRAYFDAPEEGAQAESDNTEATVQQRPDAELRQIAVHVSPNYRAAYNFLKAATSVQDQEQRISVLHLSRGEVSKARELLDFLSEG